MSEEGRSNTFKIFMLLFELVKAFLSIFGSDLKPDEKKEVLAAWRGKDDSMLS